MNLLPYLTVKDKSLPREIMCWRAATGKSRAIRYGNWKLVRTVGQPDELFNLEDDLGESKELAADQPEVKQRLSVALENWTKELKEPVFLAPASRIRLGTRRRQSKKRSEQSQSRKEVVRLEPTIESSRAAS